MFRIRYTNNASREDMEKIWVLASTSNPAEFLTTLRGENATVYESIHGVQAMLKHVLFYTMDVEDSSAWLEVLVDSKWEPYRTIGEINELVNI